MKRILFLLYGLFTYLLFLLTILYAIGFVGNIYVPKSIDGDPQLPFWQAAFIDALLLLVFAVQHSVMARPKFKEKWTRIVPEPIERSTYNLFACICLILVMWQWQPLGGTIWKVENVSLQKLLMVTYLVGWGMVFISTFLINHFDLLGVRQVWLYFRGKPYESLRFRIPGLYKMVRHPLYLGFLIAFWSASTMTAAHFLFSLLCTGYILTAIRFEEKDLESHFRSKYTDYKDKVPMIIPFFKTRKKEGKKNYSTV